jgi:preprotein translocase SecE subunit
MAFGIYKPGQGYWVRVLTAAFAGILVLAAAGWLWGQLQRAGQYIPHPTWQVLPSGPAGVMEQPGTEITLLGPQQAPGQPGGSIGTATVVGPAEGGGIEVGNVRLNAGADPLMAQFITAEQAPEPIPLRGAPRPVPMFETIYLQAAGVGLLLLLSSILIYYYVAVRPGSAEFLIATDGEMKKVNWSTRRDVMNSTLVVILWAFLLAGGLFIVDGIFATLFELIGVLQA